jgi:hypothetical protein
MLVYTCNPSTPESEAGGLQVQGQPMLHSESLPPPPTKKKKSLKGYVKTNKRGTAVAHACKPSYSGGRDGGWGRNFSLKTASKELVRPPSQPIARCVGMCLSSHLFRKCK